ncbi:FxsA family protein [Ovoidimarina sediminis]|uniref:FxsA family protein n=1 Tax=Ovoidimarina sediminis TaxID=3079856 RepID=UPI0029131788|nr:FxsA family protein [Rhodophyticola sp. MJ-SS7]MDU8942528.1 FxsA family protein [Rhodophyticola sp. MJ-SS7]
MWLLALFIAVPLIEIALFIQIGGAIGLWPTLLVVVLTAIAGTALVRSQGLHALSSLKSSVNELRDPSEPLAHGAMILFSGALLLTPGFFTDTVGFLLLVPGVRNWVIARVRERVQVTQFEYGTRAPHEPRPDDVIDGEYEEVGPEPRRDPNRPSKPSGWTQH